MNSYHRLLRFQIPANAPAAARSALKLLLKLRHDALTVQFPDGSMHRFGDHDRKRSARHADVEKLERLFSRFEIWRHRFCRNLHRWRLVHTQLDGLDQSLHQQPRCD